MTQRKLIDADQFLALFNSDGEIQDIEVKEQINVFSDYGRRQVKFFNCLFRDIEIKVDRQVEIVFSGNCEINKLILTAPPNTLTVVFAEDTVVKYLALVDYWPSVLHLHFRCSNLVIANSPNFKIGNLDIVQKDADRLELLKITGSIRRVLIKSFVQNFECCESSVIEEIGTYGNFGTLSFVGVQCDQWNSNFLVADLIDIKENNHFIQGVVLKNIKLTSFRFDTSTICKQLHLGTLNSSERSGSRNKIETLIFHHDSQSANYFGVPCLFEKIKFDILDFTGYSSLENFVLKDVVVEKQLNLNGIDLREPIFNIVDLRRCDLRIYRTNFIKPTFRYVEWPTNNKFYEFEDIKLRKDNTDDYILKLKDLREGYRQMKKHFIEHDDKFDAMIFQSNELRTQLRIKSVETWRRDWKSRYDNFGDWFLLATNNKFSNFGLSWTRPLFWWLCVFHLMLFYLLLINFDLGIKPFYDPYTGNLNSPSWDATLEGLYLYMKILFPVHDADIKIPFTCPAKTRDIWGISDFFMRIVSGYFIFLIIRGTRKFNFKTGSGSEM
jgi:hypothetical protein